MSVCHHEKLFLCCPVPGCESAHPDLPQGCEPAKASLAESLRPRRRCAAGAAVSGAREARLELLGQQVTCSHVDGHTTLDVPDLV